MALLVDLTGFSLCLHPLWLTTPVWLIMAYNSFKKHVNDLYNYILGSVLLFISKYSCCTVVLFEYRRVSPQGTGT